MSVACAALCCCCSCFRPRRILPHPFFLFLHVRSWRVSLSSRTASLPTLLHCWIRFCIGGASIAMADARAWDHLLPIGSSASLASMDFVLALTFHRGGTWSEAGTAISPTLGRISAVTVLARTHWACPATPVAAIDLEARSQRASCARPYKVMSSSSTGRRFLPLQVRFDHRLEFVLVSRLRQDRAWRWRGAFNRSRGYNASSLIN